MDIYIDTLWSLNIDFKNRLKTRLLTEYVADDNNCKCYKNRSNLVGN